ncbi:MAG: UDP-3-O-(3-hydroxymyristoyl)glucosamine N-acyltransferase [Acidobacteria bacterium]|nr:UDP-3-O-(3-hydroxymyristoyl)glucosamine N-acyltransferase [Acidobacteriota bacterium]
MLVREIADFLGATFEGDGERAIDGVASLEAAGSTQISFVGSRRAQRDAQASSAGCLIVRPDFDNSGGRTVIRRPDPRNSFAHIVGLLRPPDEPAPGVHPTAVVGRNCVIGEGVTIGPCCVVGDRVTIGPGSRLHANVTVYSDVTIGARALIHAGAVIGADGFGFVFENGRYVKFPQVGTVVIGDDVEIGANSTVDRAALGVTSVGDGTKLDDLVHVGHNCRVGRHVVIAAQTGMAGGTVIEDNAIIGGQVGMGDNVTVKARAVVGSGAGILSSKVLKGDGEVYWGTPARPLKQYLESLANVNRIPDLREGINELKLKLAELEKKLK